MLARLNYVLVHALCTDIIYLNNAGKRVKAANELVNDELKQYLYQVHYVISHSARIKRLRGKALIEDNGYSLVKINNAVCKPFKLALGSLSEKQ
jgi:hypothetical protein